MQSCFERRRPNGKPPSFCSGTVTNRWLLARVNVLESSAYASLRPGWDSPYSDNGRVVDFDGDGQMDLLVPWKSGGDNEVRYDWLTVSGDTKLVTEARRTVYTATLDTLTSPPGNVPGILDENCSMLVDINGDGTPDLVNFKGGFSVRYNLG